MLFLSLQRSDLVLCGCNSFPQNIVSIFDSFAYLINLDLLCLRFSPCSLFPKLGGDIFIEAFASGKIVEELIVLASTNERVGIEALLFEDLSDFLDAEHWLLLRVGSVYRVKIRKINSLICLSILSILLLI